MVKIDFPAIAIPAFKVKRGQLLDVSLLGVGLVIPPIDITFWESVKLTDKFTILDTDKVAEDLLTGIGDLVQTFGKGLEVFLEQQIEDYYKKYPEARKE